jgi:ATP-dependent DNA helicase RecG
MSRPVPERESLTVEFKSDQGPLPDAELTAAVVCLANTEGGDLYVGVESDGSVTGLHPRHRNVTGVIALIANRTSPSLSVRAELLDADGRDVVRIRVPKADSIVSTSDGLVQRRRLQADGTPACVPMYPHEFSQRLSDLRRVDYSALPVAGATEEDLDPLERQRLRNLVSRYGGDSTLLALSDAELDGALGILAREGERRVPTVAGLLTIGREQALRTHVPTHEVAIQDLSGTRVRLNEFTRRPLLDSFERVFEQHFTARVVEDELQVGMFRVPVPNYDRRALREGVVNALVHRDYTRLGAVHIRWEADGLIISNPGGFVEGVTLDRLLVTEPRPRNPLLADMMKRVGLAERTGRGVDLIYQGLLRYGRPAPDYSRSDASNVVLRLPQADADLPFLELILEEERRTGAPMPVDTLIALAQLRAAARLDISALSRTLQRDETETRALLGRLMEAGLVQAHGSARNREYSLSAAVYRRLGRAADYVRQAAFDDVQQEQMVLHFVRQHGRITRREAAELCRLSSDQAKHLLLRLAGEQKLIGRGRGRAVYYEQP